VDKHSVALPPYQSDSTATQYVQPEWMPTASKSKLKARRRSRHSQVVDLLLAEGSSLPLPVDVWPDEAPLRQRRPHHFSKVAVRVVKMGVGASLLAIMGLQTLVKAWTKSEIWVKNAVVAVALTLVSVHLLVSSFGLLGNVLNIHMEIPVLQGIYQAHQNKNTQLKSQIHRIQTGEDAELLARDYLDMVHPDEVLLKIQAPSSLIP
jgi:cell division protein FtsB